MKTIIILSGIPCSGKTTYTNYLLSNKDYVSISRDSLRDKYFGKEYQRSKYGGEKYVYSRQNEKFISLKFDETMDEYLENPNIKYIIMDNTHCKEKYLDDFIKIYKRFTNIQVIFFDTPLIKSYYRNIIRYIKTGKFIPFSIIKNMNINYRKINKGKYIDYFNTHHFYIN